MEKSGKRYSFQKVLVVVFGINAFFTLLGVFVLVAFQLPEAKEALAGLSTPGNILKQLAGIFCQALFFFFSLNHYNKIIVEKKPGKYFILFTLLLLVIAFSYFWGMHLLTPPKAAIGVKNSKGLYLFSAFISGAFFTGASILLAYLNNLRDEKKQRKVLEAQKLQLEVDKSQANFKFLKSQINPHFLHNTLNFLYAKSLPYSAELSEGILTLSDIMRYALNETTSEDGKAFLKDEIEHVRNVIRINQLRFSNNLHVNFEVNGVVNGIKIIPFLLITVVENAFKHGDLQRSDEPIVIKLTIDHQGLYFYCHNRKKKGPKEISTGLGLDNIRNRLDYTYGNHYKLLIKDEAAFYTTELTIDEL